MKHTPGPWIFKDADRDSGSFDIDSEEGFFIAETISGLGHEEQENARLIAAAPDLLEAVNRLLVCMSLANWENDDAAVFARAAIAKATGEQA